MTDNPKAERTQHPPVQATLDTLGSAGQPADRTAQGPAGPPSLPPTTPDVPPELAALQGYEIVRELGRGGMGVVYLAHNKLINRPEVLKVMNRALVGRPEAVERFLQEIRSAGKLMHANVATTFSAYQLGDLLVLAMEFVEGDDLSKAVRERGPLPIANACFCVHQAAMALQRGYELDMVHRDIKPSNILLAKQGKRAVVKVIDFGLAKAKSEVATDRDLTGTNQMMGTPGYTAPEQLRDAKTADTRSDIYSLGCTLYHLLAGEPPFKGKTMYAILFAQDAGHMRPLREARPEVPEALAQIVARMMARNPAERFRQPGDVAAALVPFIKTESSAEVPRIAPKPARSAAPPQSVPPTLPTQPEAHSRSIRVEAEAPEPPRAEAPPAAPVSDGRAVDPARRPARSHAGAKKNRAKQDSFVAGRWPVLIGAAVGLTVVLLMVLAGIVVKLTVKSEAGDALLVVEVNEPNPLVYVDGQRVNVTWGVAGHQAEVTVKAGVPHQVKVIKDGFTADGETVTISEGGRKVLTASLTRLPTKPRPKDDLAKRPAIPSPDAPSEKPEEIPVGFDQKPTTGDPPPAPVKEDPGRPQPLDCTGANGAAAADIRRAQEAWAKYLGRDVEANVDIGNGVTMTFMLIPPGKFLMGSPSNELGKNGRYHNETIHEVTLTEPFDMGKYEVTQAQYQALTGQSPSFYKGADRPVEQVTWRDADAFGRRLTKKLSGRHVYRLATEAEWEYSCRGGRPVSLAFGVGDGRNLAPRDANFNNIVGQTSNVGSYAANALGLFDMHGNVWEWCADWNEPYPPGPVTNPLCTTGGPFRVARGGCHNEPAPECRSALRQGSPEDRHDCWMGFRLARSLPTVRQ
jgi:formylglycine-generating enzyme required for sulfatase activity/serine/threonine protein kinase